MAEIKMMTDFKRPNVTLDDEIGEAQYELSKKQFYFPQWVVGPKPKITLEKAYKRIACNEATLQRLKALKQQQTPVQISLFGPDMSTREKEAEQLDKQDAYYEPMFSNDNLQNELWTATAELGADSPLDSQIDDFLHFLWQKGFVVARMDSVRELNK